MSADGDTVREALEALGPHSFSRVYEDALAALARLEAAETRRDELRADLAKAMQAIVKVEAQRDEATQGGIVWAERAHAAEEALAALAGEPAMLDRLRAAEAQRDEWQRVHEATWARLPKSVQTIYMREYRAALAEAGL